jgi:hypothetical protein
MFWEDQYKRLQATKEDEYIATKASLLLAKYGIAYADMTPVCLDDDAEQRWVACDQPRRETDDACEHYVHCGGHYVFDYHQHLWRLRCQENVVRKGCLQS